jgi:hypothetical protein
MTAPTEHLKAIADAIESHYNLARVELFRPFEEQLGLERYTTARSIGASDFDHWCTPRYDTFYRDEPTEALAASVQRVKVLAVEIASTATRKSGHPVVATVRLFANIAICNCGRLSPWPPQTFEQWTVRVSMEWMGRTLSREYLLPETA